LKVPFLNIPQPKYSGHDIGNTEIQEKYLHRNNAAKRAQWF